MTSCDPCGVAGIKLMVREGAVVGGREEVVGGGTTTRSSSWLGVGAKEDPDVVGRGPTIRPSMLTSEGVVLLSGTEEAPPWSSSSTGRSSTGRKRGVDGDLERSRGRGPGASRMWSGTSRSRSSIRMRDRKVSSEPANRSTVPSMASTRCLVRAVSSATASRTLIRSSSTARRLPCSTPTSEK